VATNGNNDVIVTGYFMGTADFGGGLLTSAGSSDIFVAKYSAAETHLWSQRFGGSNIDEGIGVAADGNALTITGRFLTTIDFGDGPMTTAGSADLYLATFWP
jgi:hypothetical protein